LRSNLDPSQPKIEPGKPIPINRTLGPKTEELRIFRELLGLPNKFYEGLTAQTFISFTSKILNERVDPPNNGVCFLKKNLQIIHALDKLYKNQKLVLEKLNAVLKPLCALFKINCEDLMKGIQNFGESDVLGRSDANELRLIETELEKTDAKFKEQGIGNEHFEFDDDGWMTEVEIAWQAINRISSKFGPGTKAGVVDESDLTLLMTALTRAKLGIQQFASKCKVRENQKELSKYLELKKIEAFPGVAISQNDPFTFLEYGNAYQSLRLGEPYAFNLSRVPASQSPLTVFVKHPSNGAGDQADDPTIVLERLHSSPYQIILGQRAELYYLTDGSEKEGIGLRSSLSSSGNSDLISMSICDPNRINLI
jgi:hypothetical protein